MSPTKQKRQFSAFTLVELIVVIVILAILATIAFLSFSSYSSSARDSNRLSDVSNIAKGLQVQYTTSGKYPRSGEKEITLYKGDVSNSSNVLGYQAVAGKKILSDIKSSDGGVDPVDGSYYTYSTNKAGSKFEVVGFLENNYNVALDGSKTSYTGVTSRYPFTKGDELGVLIENHGGKLTPLQMLASAPNGTQIDVTSSTGIISTNKDLVAVTSTKSIPTININLSSTLTAKYTPSRYSGCNTDDIVLNNGQIWAVCNVGASKAYNGETIIQGT